MPFFFLFHAPCLFCCCSSLSLALSAASSRSTGSPYTALFASSINKEIIKKKSRGETYDNRFTLAWPTPNDIYHTPQ